MLGPFPNVRNTLAGTWTCSINAAGSSQLDVTYDTMIDGNGGVIKAKDGSTRRKVSFREAILLPGQGNANEGATLTLVPDEGTGTSLVFKLEPDLDGALKDLRVDRPDDWNEPKEPSPALKFPWDKN